MTQSHQDKTQWVGAEKITEEKRKRDTERHRGTETHTNKEIERNRQKDKERRKRGDSEIYECV